MVKNQGLEGKRGTGSGGAPNQKEWDSVVQKKSFYGITCYLTIQIFTFQIIELWSNV